MENSSEIVSVVGPDGTLRYASPAVERVMGYRPEEMVGMNVLDYVHPEDLPLVVEETEKALAEPGVARNAVGYRFRHKDGSWRYIESTVANLLDDPHVRGVVVVSRDVTGRKRAEEAEEKLRESEERYRSVVEGVKEVVFRTDAEGRWTFLNPAWQEITGFPVEESLGESYLGFVHPDDLERNLRDMERMGEHGEGHSRYEARFRTRAGAARWMEVNFREHFDREGNLTGTSGTLDDVTERREAEERLKESEERYRTLVEQVPAVNYTLEPVPEGETTLEGAVTYISPQAERVLGHPPDAFTADRGFWMSLVHPEDRERVLDEDRRTDETGEPFSMEYRMAHRDGRTLWVRDEAALVRDGAGRPRFWQGVLLDVTERKMLEQELERRATHDPLTGLPNRALLSERLGQTLARARRRGSEPAVLFVDLDDFKEVNDVFGHEAGDRLLTGVADRLKNVVRPEDTVARLGGDEFVVLLEAADGERAIRVAERIAAALETPMNLGGTEVSITVSVGIAPGGPRSGGPDDLLREADRAMYRAKKEGKARYFTSSGEEPR